MSADLIKRLEAASRTLSDELLFVCHFGSGSPDSDFDFLMVADSHHPLETIEKFLKAALPIEGDEYFYISTIFEKPTKRDAQNRRLIHSLNYDSMLTLQLTEVPSFTAYLYDKANFIIGDRRRLLTGRTQYMSRSAMQMNVLDVQLCHYKKIATDANNHASLDSRYWKSNSELLLGKLLYALRFVCTEFLVTKLREDFRSAWHWDDLITLAKNYRGIVDGGLVADILTNRNKIIHGQKREDASTIAHLVFEIAGKCTLGE